MKNQEEWEGIYSDDTFRHKNKYPHTAVVRFIMRNYAESERAKVRILDLGCGWGNNLKFLVDEGFDAYGIDFSETAVKHCKAFTENVFLGDIAKLPFEDDFFDCIINRMAIQHNPKERIDPIIKEVLRVLKKGGKLYSFLTENVDYDLTCSCMEEEDVELIGKMFEGGHQIDYIEQSQNNRKEVNRVNVLLAEK